MSSTTPKASPDTNVASPASGRPEENTEPSAGQRRMTAPTFDSRFRVRSYELDALGHVNHAVFVNYFEQARVEVLEQVGFAWDELLDRGWLFNVVHIEVDYRRDARMGDTIRVSTRVDSFGNTSMTLSQRASKDDEAGAVVAEASVVGVLVGHDGRPMRIPDELRGLLAEPPARARD